MQSYNFEILTEERDAFVLANVPEPWTMASVLTRPMSHSGIVLPPTPALPMLSIEIGRVFP